MSNFVYPYLRPIKDLWLSLTTDQNQKRLFEYKGQAGSLGTDWVSRYIHSEQDVINDRYLYLHKSFNQQPELKDVLLENIYRLSLFAGFERIITLRQALLCTRAQFQVLGNSFSSSAQAVLNGGVFSQGYFRGSLLNLLQFTLVPYQALLWSQNTGFVGQAAALSIFEGLFYPLDTVKTALYCDTTGKYNGAFSCLKDLVSKNGILGLFRGVEYKLGYNLVFLFHLNNVYENSVWQWASLPLWVSSYALLTMKSRLQISDSSASLANLAETKRLRFCQTYAGVIPWAIFNHFFMYQFLGWYSQSAQQQRYQELEEEGKKFQSPFQIRQIVN